MMVSLNPNFIAYRNKGYNGGIKIFGTGTPLIDLTLKIWFCSKFFKIIPHSFATSSSPKKIIAIILNNAPVRIIKTNFFS